MKLVLIRHERTPGNQLGRYIGITDEDLIPIENPMDLQRYPRVQRVYASPLKRCRQTAELLYPGQEIRIKENFRECNFGRFENKNYQELASDPAYQEWIDSNGTMQFPDGEEPSCFRERCRETFNDCVAECIADGVSDIAMVVHGGTIMSILEAFDERKLGFYDYQVKNGDGFVVTLEQERWKLGEHRILNVEKRILEENKRNA